MFPPAKKDRNKGGTALIYLRSTRVVAVEPPRPASKGWFLEAQPALCDNRVGWVPFSPAKTPPTPCPFLRCTS